MSEAVTEPAFAAGDKVLVNGTLVAEIDYYDESNDVLRYITKANSQTNVTTAHVSQTRLEHLVSDVVASDEKPSDEPGQHSAAESPADPTGDAE
jgi:hypothetical protein